LSLIDCGPTVVTPSTPVAPYADGAWHMVTATWDKTAYATLYVDGVQKARVLDSGCYATNMQGVDKFYIGAYPDVTGLQPQSGYFFSGSMSDVRIFNRELTATEINSFYIN